VRREGPERIPYGPVGALPSSVDLPAGCRRSRHKAVPEGTRRYPGALRNRRLTVMPGYAAGIPAVGAGGIRRASLKREARVQASGKDDSHGT
jgi:hypothetical protein